MQTLINACRRIVSVAVEIRTLPGINFIKADSMYMRLFVVKEMLEKYKPPEEDRLTQEETRLIELGRAVGKVFANIYSELRIHDVWPSGDIRGTETISSADELRDWYRAEVAKE